MTDSMWRGSRARGMALAGLVFAGTAFFGAAPEARAQVSMSATETEEADVAGQGIELGTFVGLLMPLTNLANSPDPGAVLSPDVIFAGQVMYWVGSHVGIEINGSYAPAELTGVARTDGVVTDFGGVDYMAASAALTFRIPDSGTASGIEPYISIGGGARQIDFSPAAADVVEAALDPSAVLAGGMRVRVRTGVWLRTEVRGMMAFRDGPDGIDRQTDIAVGFGLGIR